MKPQTVCLTCGLPVKPLAFGLGQWRHTAPDRPWTLADYPSARPAYPAHRARPDLPLLVGTDTQ